MISFQFPSNGKVYPKQEIGRGAGTVRVSIPFKRESVSKEGCPDQKRWRGIWVSIPFKRESVSKEELSHWPSIEGNVLMFQFPSNGKVYPK